MSGQSGGGGGGNQERFSGEDPEALKKWKNWVEAELLSQWRKGRPGEKTHDRTTRGPYINKLLDGDAVDLFEESE